MVLNEVNRSAAYEGKEIPSTRLEFQLFSLLYTQKNTVVSYEELEKCITPNKEERRHTNARVANLIHHLREKMGEESVKVIQTVQSRGDRLVVIEIRRRILFDR